jgi:transcriptional regulator with PAS, ATPase and Fis domain
VQFRLDEQTADASAMGWVLVTIGDGDLRAYPLTARTDFLMGRDLDCDIVLEHHRVSRRHARVRVAEVGDALVIEDLGSRSGTRVGEPLAPNQPHLVHAGDAIAIGPFTLIALREPAFLPMSTFVVEDPLAAGASPSLIGVARSPANLLIRGEPGVGKRVLADEMHRLSERPGGMSVIDCSAIDRDGLAAELAAAGAGTVLVDEIDAAPAALQEELLRAVERRVADPAAPAVRFISTTYRDLVAAVEAGELRLDLYYRLAGVTLSIPPLRERRAPIAPIAQELLAAAAEREGRTAPALSAAAVARLQAHDWPGNVRELRLVLERALESAGGAAIDTEHLVFDEPAPGAPHPDAGAAPDADAERRRILHALERCHGNPSRAAKLLGISRSALATKLALYRSPRARPRK